jgi:hypothetical protein
MCQTEFPVTESAGRQTVRCPECDEEFEPSAKAKPSAPAAHLAGEKPLPLVDPDAPPKPTKKGSKKPEPAAEKPTAKKTETAEKAPAGGVTGAPRKRRRREDEEDEEDDRKGKSGGGMATLAVAGASVVGLVVVIGGVFLAVRLFSGKPADVAVAPTTVPSQSTQPTQPAPSGRTPPMVTAPSAPTRPPAPEPSNPGKSGTTGPKVAPPPPPPPVTPRPPVAQPEKPKTNWRLPPRPDPLPITPAPLTAATTVSLPGPAQKAVFGGGGRFVVIHIPSLRQLAVFDTSTLKLRYIPVAEEQVLFAAGMTHVLAYLPSAGLLQRYDLQTGKRDKSAPFEATKPTAFCMGSASAGPLLVRDEKKGVRFVDPATFEELTPPTDNRGYGFGLGGALFWASADGRTFGHTGNYGMPNGVNITTIGQDKFTGASQHWGTSYVVPSPDGRRLFAGGYPPLTAQVAPAPDGVGTGAGNSGHVSQMFLPAAHGPFYVHLLSGSGLPGAPTPKKKGKGPTTGGAGGTIAVYIFGLSEPLVTLEDTGHGNAGGGWSVGHENKVFFVPKAKILAVIDGTGEKIRVFPVDVEAALKSSSANVVLVTSEPPAGAVKGKPFRYKVEGFSKAGGLTFAVEAGSPGMAVGSDGVVTWDVPATFADKEVNVILRVTDKAGHEAFHSFALTVGEAGG